MKCSIRHWQTLSEELGIQVQPKPTLTFAKCLEMGLDQHVETIAKVAEVAGKEFSIEQISEGACGIPTFVYFVTQYASTIDELKQCMQTCLVYDMLILYNNIIIV